jgi:hypothetical protein
MYEATHVYPALKTILQSRLQFRAGVERLLDTCREHCPDSAWDTIADYDYTAELDRFTRWYSDNVACNVPPNDVEVLWFAPHDIPTDLDLRGSSKWSRDPEDWQWFYHDDYDGPSYTSKLVTEAYWLTDYEGIVPKRTSPANHPHEVVEFVYSLGIYGLCVRELVRSVDASAILGNRSSRWLVIGHPDSVYGVILGTLTRSRWQTYHG